MAFTVPHRAFFTLLASVAADAAESGWGGDGAAAVAPIGRGSDGTAAATGRADEGRRALYRQRFLTASLASESGGACQGGTVRGARTAVPVGEREKGGEADGRLRGCFAQVVKETALCFVALNGQQRRRTVDGVSSAEREGEGAPRDAFAERGAAMGQGHAPSSRGGVGVGAGRTTSSLSARRSARQEALVRFTQALLAAALREEQRTQRLTAALRSTPPPHPHKTTAAAATLLSVPVVPLHKWVGRRHYGGFLSKETQRSGAAAGGDCSFHFPVLSGADGVKHFQQPEDLAQEVAAYWRLHEETAARARLRALRAKDAEAFAEHVSLLKVSTLLKIMEKTHDFMMRIGLRLQHKADSSASAERPSAGTTTRDDPDSASGYPLGVRSSSEYQRFKAYVASTKDDFRLVHKVDVFVERQPVGLKATLLPHQLDGLRFLVSLHENGINGILADEMGVGKTIQTLSFLLFLKERRPPATTEHRPHLVLAPLSVLREWREACKRFAPDSMRVAALQELSDPVQEAQAYDILLMPTHSARLPWVREAASRVVWGYLVVDEAHKAVANLQTQTAQAILSFPFQRRLVLTGTPLNSDLQELWSLLHFLNPEVFSDGDSFDEVFRRPFATYDAAEMALSSEERGLLVLRLHQILRPFMLRRTKRDVDNTLKFTAHIVHCPMTAMQAELMTLLRGAKRTPTTSGDDPASSSSSSSSSSLSSSDGSDDGGERREEEANGGNGSATAMKGYRLTAEGVSESTAQLLCNHAFLLPFFSRVLAQHGLSETTPSSEPSGAADMVLACSGKFMALHLLLSRLFLAKRKAVLFTHWLDSVDLLQEYMTGRGWGGHVEVLTGSTSEEERETRVRRFREDDTCFFLVLSTKAGGCGINLQCAHVVVMLDRDYVTTNEEQALARVYRIGQVHTVRAVYFTTDDPAERRVTEQAERKNKPREAIIEGGNYRVDDAASGATSAEAGNEAEQREGELSAEEKGGAADEKDSASLSLPLHCNLMMALWQSSTAAAGGSGRDDEGTADNDTAGGAVTTAERWRLLRSLVRTFDELVLTQSDAPDSAVRHLLASHLPKEDGHGQGAATDAVCDASTPFWEGFWRLWREAQEGPPLLHRALTAAVENDKRLYDPAEQHRRRERRRQRQARHLERFVHRPPPNAWYMDCWEKGIEDEGEIVRLYRRRQREKAAAAERQRRAREDRIARLAAKKHMEQARKEVRETSKRTKKARPTPSSATAEPQSKSIPNEEASAGEADQAVVQGAATALPTAPQRRCGGRPLPPARGARTGTRAKEPSGKEEDNGERKAGDAPPPPPPPPPAAAALSVPSDAQACSPPPRKAPRVENDVGVPVAAAEERRLALSNADEVVVRRARGRRGTTATTGAEGRGGGRPRRTAAPGVLLCAERKRKRPAQGGLSAAVTNDRRSSPSVGSPAAAASTAAAIPGLASQPRDCSGEAAAETTCLSEDCERGKDLTARRLFTAAAGSSSVA